MKKTILFLIFIIAIVFINTISAKMAFAKPENYSKYLYYHRLANNALKGNIEDLNLIKKNAIAGNSFAQAELGYYYTKNNNYTSGMYWNKKAAFQNNYVAENALGNYYYTGLGVNSNYSKSLYWFRKSSAQGFANAESNLGSFYLRGLAGLNKNYQEAIYLFKKSANQDFYYAEYALGFIYFHGKGVPVNYQYARYWFEKSAQKGYGLADVELAVIYTKGLGVPRSFKEAFYYSKRSGIYKLCYYAAINYIMTKYLIAKPYAKPKAAYVCEGLK